MEKFVKILKKLFPFTIILILVYFVPPIFILVQQEEEVIERMLTADLMILNPGISFIAAMAFGVRNGFHWYFVLLVVILFFLCLLFIYGFSFFGFLLSIVSTEALGVPYLAPHPFPQQPLSEDGVLRRNYRQLSRHGFNIWQKRERGKRQT